jgi:hypothetical protein
MAPEDYDQALLERVAQSRAFESDVRMFRMASTSVLYSLRAALG